MSTPVHAHPHPAPDATRRDAAARRLDYLGWGLFLLVTGAFWSFGARVHEGAWLTTVGALLLLVAAARFRAGIRQNTALLILGGLALAGGAAGLAHATLPLVALVLVAFGVYLVGRYFVARRD